MSAFRFVVFADIVIGALLLPVMGLLIVIVPGELCRVVGEFKVIGLLTDISPLLFF